MTMTIPENTAAPDFGAENAQKSLPPVAEAVAAEPVAWTDEQIIELAVAHSNYRETGADGTEFEVISHARLIAFSRALVARLQQEIQRLTERELQRARHGACPSRPSFNPHTGEVYDDAVTSER